MEEIKKQMEQENKIENEPKEEMQKIEINPIDEAKRVLEETKNTLLLISEERRKIEKATAEILINGRSYAGKELKIETDEEKWAREAKIRYEGTGLDPTI